MSQADSPNTTSPSRRTVLAGLSVATASVAAVDILLAARVPGDDPILAVINLNRQAMAACVEARKRYGEYRNEKIAETGLLIGDYPDDRDTKPERPLVAYDKWDLEAFACGLPESEQEAWVEKKFDELCDLRKKELAEDANTPRGIAWNAWNDSCNVLASTMELLIETRPATIAGVAAVLQHWLEFTKADTGMEVVGDEVDTARFLEGLAEAAKAVG
jgi:hypothetical protein